MSWRDRLAKRDKAIIYCLISSGCRAGEFLALNVSDVNLVSGEIFIEHGKGDKSRTVFISPEARRALRAYLRIFNEIETSSPIWMTYTRERRLTISGLRSIIQKRARLARISPPRLHDFRRTFALEAHRSGIPILVISKLLGHSQISTTTRYLNIDENDLRREYGKLSLFE